MKLGLNIFLEDYVNQFKNKRIGLVTNLTGVNECLKPTIDLFFNHLDINLVALYGPEHGIRGDAKEGENVDFTIDEQTNLPVYSLYGETRKPTKNMLHNVDVLVLDLQDIGSRYYTYIYTLAFVMEACKEYNKELVVLDRPNPISGLKREGNLVDKEYSSFVSMFPIPNRHGLTMGELAHLYKYEFGYDCNLTVVQMEGWQRSMYFEETGLFWVSPSPNATSIDMCILYSGTCLFEGTNVSEGRGTTKPFEIIGAPFINGFVLAERFNGKKLPGIIARPLSFKPTYQKYKNELCFGVQLHITDRYEINPLEAAVTLMTDIAIMYPDDFTFLKDDKENKYFFDFLAGNGDLRELILKGNTEVFFKEAEDQLVSFEKLSEPYYLYN